MDTIVEERGFVAAINDLFAEQIPLNKLPGLKVESLRYERVQVPLPVRVELMGCHKPGMHHGGG